jgi:hydrogenase maturation protease
MNERTLLLILGLGNVLLEDDGVGPVAVRALVDGYIPSVGVQVFDGGTLGLSLLPYVDAADAVILVDAVRADAAAGTCVRLDGDDVAPAVATRLSPHQIGVADLLDGARWLDRLPRRVTLLGIVPESMGLAVGLTSVVRDALPDLLELIVDTACEFGFPFRRKLAHEMAVNSGTADVARLAGMQ